MRIARLIPFAAAVLFLASCDLEVDNSAPPGAAPLSSSGSGDPGSAATAGDGSGAVVPVAGDGSGGAGAPDGGTGTPPPPAGGTSAAASHQVNLRNMQYVDARSNGTTTTSKVGDTIVWQNVDSMDHTVTSDTGLFDAPLAQGGSFKFTFTKAGTYPYSCMKHKSTMKGTVVVLP